MRHFTRPELQVRVPRVSAAIGCRCAASERQSACRRRARGHVV